MSYPKTALRTKTAQIDHIDRVLNDADHHAKSVRDILEPLRSVIYAARDKGTDIEARKHTTWFWISGKQYVASWNRSVAKVGIRENSQFGKTLTSFDNTNDTTDLIAFFDSLK
jgi:hypothetical protein